MAVKRKLFEIIDTESDDSISDECECDAWEHDKNAALKEYFKKQKIEDGLCPGCAFYFYSKMYDFLYSSRILMQEDMFAKVMVAYLAILAAYDSMKPKEVYFCKEFYEFVYKTVTKLVIERKSKLMGGFHSDFYSLFDKLTNILNYCGGRLPSKMVEHQNFDKST